MALAPPSLLLFLVSSSVWVALCLPLTILRVAAAAGPGGEHCHPQLCGNVNISSPFWFIGPDEGAKPNRCGSAEFQISCINNIPYFAYYQSQYSLRILSIFYDNRSLHVADTNQRHPYFNRSSIHEGCHIPTADTVPKFPLPFSVGPFNQSLIFYNCTKPPLPHGVDLVDTVCLNNTFVRVADGRSDESEGSYFLEGCTAAMVPVLGVSGRVNASNYEQLVRDGFLATWRWPWPPPPPPPSGN